MEFDLEKLYKIFEEKLTAVSGECYRVKLVSDASELIKCILLDKGVKSVAITDSMIARDANLPGFLLNSGFSVYQERFREKTSYVDAGITQANWAIAEIGTLVQDETDVNKRLCSSLVPIHVAMVRTSALIPTLADALSAINQLPQIPGFVGFITGPSRTSDIERVLTVGVHGPLQLIVVFVDEQIAEVA